MHFYYVLIYSCIVTCGIICLLLDLIGYSEKQTDKIKIYRLLKTVFDNVYFPFGIYCAIVFSLDIIQLKEDVTLLITTIVLTILSFGIERIMEYAARPITLKEEYLSQDKPIFTLMDVYSDLKLKNQSALANLLDMQIKNKNIYEKNVEENAKLANALDKYIVVQNEECLNLLNEMNKCELAFLSLETNAKNCNNAFTDFQRKLDNANASFEYYQDSETLINDIQYSFHALYTYKSDMIMKEIDDIILKLNNIALKCSGFQDFHKPLFHWADIYSVKIEATLKLLQEKYMRDTTNNRELVEAFKEISNTIVNFEMKIKEIIGVNELFLHKNLFVLSKILETYNT